MRLMFKYLRPKFGRMSVGLTIKILGTVVELFIPYILSHILKTVVAKEDIGEILFYGGIMLACAASACVLNIIANRMASAVARDFSKSIRHDLFAKTISLSARNADRITVASLESRITTDTYHVHQFVGMVQRMGIRAPILLIGGVGITLIMDAYLALAMIATLPFIFITVYFISRKGVPLYAKVQKSVDGMVRVVREDTQGIRVIKALSKNEYENQRYDKVNSALSKDERIAGTVMGAVNPVMTLLMNVGITIVVALSASRVAGHTSDPETVIAFMQYFTLISMAMMTMSRMFIMFTRSSASAGRIEEILMLENELTVDPAPKTSDKGYHIEFSGVGFSYLGKGNNLTDVSFGIKKGQHLGIIGATGSGKSTILRLLLRFYDVNEGCVFINGIDVKGYSEDQLSSMFGVALQNDFLYADTIKENIRFNRDIDDSAIERAARIACAEEFITSFPDGYGHMLSQKGSNLSGGQKQRLLIARAVASDPEILILDDSSSALDYKTDAALRHNLRENMKNSTIITVAQRVSSVKDCDLILVVEDGVIIGRGTHGELIESCSEYREIADSQMGGAIVE